VSTPTRGLVHGMVDGIVGRQRELETLRACLDAACDGAGRLVLRHLADQVAGARLLVLAAFRDVEPASVLRRVLPDLLRSPGGQAPRPRRGARAAGQDDHG
jgi:hypothetical protein